MDFGREMLLVAALGTGPTGGCVVAIDSVAATAADLYVRIMRPSPGAQCVTPTKATSPAVIVRVPRSDRVTRFVERSEVLDCR